MVGLTDSIQLNLTEEVARNDNREYPTSLNGDQKCNLERKKISTEGTEPRIIYTP